MHCAKPGQRPKGGPASGKPCRAGNLPRCAVPAVPAAAQPARNTPFSLARRRRRGNSLLSPGGLRYQVGKAVGEAQGADHQEDDAVTVRRFGLAALMGLALVIRPVGPRGRTSASWLAHRQPPAHHRGRRIAEACRHHRRAIASKRSTAPLSRRCRRGRRRCGVERFGGQDQPSAKKCCGWCRACRALRPVARSHDVWRPATPLFAPRPRAGLPPKLPPDAEKNRLPDPLPKRANGSGSGTGGCRGRTRKGIGEPVPVFRGPIPGNLGLNPPKMPPYAWPTYAPYNNFSRVATPRPTLQRLAVHRAVLSVPEDSAGLAVGETGVGRRPLVVRPGRQQVRLVADPVLVRSAAFRQRSAGAADGLPRNARG